MKHQTTCNPVFTFCLLLSLWAYAEPGRAPQTIDRRITVMNDGQAWICENRRLSTRSGVQTITLRNVSPALLPETVTLRALPQTRAFRLMEQRFLSPSNSPGALLNQYIGRTITLIRHRDNRQEQLKGTLRSVHKNKPAVLETPEGDLVLYPRGEVRLPQTERVSPRARPVLKCEVSAPGGTLTLELCYLTKGLTWSANYVLRLPETGQVASVQGWISLQNNTGLDLENASWRLLGEETREVDAFQPYKTTRIAEYTPPQRDLVATLPTGESMRISLIQSAGVPVKRRLVFDPTRSGPAVQSPPQAVRRMAVLAFSSARGPHRLPAGKGHVLRVLPDGTRQPLGRRQIPASGSESPMQIDLGPAEGLEGNRKQGQWHHTAPNAQEQSVTIELVNQRSDNADVVIVEHPWGNWRVKESTHEPRQTGPDELEFDVPVPAGETVALTYTLEITY